MGQNLRDRAFHIGKTVLSRRREMGLQQVELAEMAGVSTRFLHSVEHGKPSIQLDKLMAILAVLGLKIAVIPVTSHG